MSSKPSELDASGVQNEETLKRGSVRTVFVFLDLPRHVEFRAGDLPLMDEGLEMEFDLCITSPKDPRKTRKVEGSYRVSRRVLKYGGSRPGMKGMTQYIEWAPRVK